MLIIIVIVITIVIVICKVHLDSNVLTSVGKIVNYFKQYSSTSLIAQEVSDDTSWYKY